MIHNENVIIAIDWATRKGVIRVKDAKRYKEVMKRYKRDMAYYKKHAPPGSRVFGSRPADAVDALLEAVPRHGLMPHGAVGAIVPRLRHAGLVTYVSLLYSI